MKNNTLQSKNKLRRLALDAILMYLEEGIHVVDQEGVTLFYNRQMANLEGILPEDIIGKPFLSVFDGFDAESSTLLTAIKTGLPMMERIQHYVHKGREITSINSTIPLRDGETIIGAIEIAKDVTKIRHLSDKVAELTQIIHETEGKSKEKKTTKKSLHPYHFDDMIGLSKEFLKQLDRAQKAAENSATVLIYGETGTGKELVAQSIHNASARKEFPFIAQNCAAIPESLLEGILFGTVKGSFTGAVDRAGLFEQAHQGTLLLDEINAMGQNLQAKLLRVLQEGYIRRVGGQKDIPIDVRIVATINERPEIAMMKGQLRRDLFYRLSVLNIHLPQLRDRVGDIDLFADYFVKKYGRKYQKDVWLISEEVKESFRAYHWPGNVREFENMIQSMISLLPMDEHVLKPEHLPQLFSTEKEALLTERFSEQGLEQTLSEIEKEQLEKALRKHGGNISQAAAQLKIKRQTLQHKMKKYKISAK